MRLLLVMFLLLPRFAFGDGLPYHHDGELIGEFVILHMNDEQFNEVDMKRTITLNIEQTAFLSRLFNEVPKKLAVVSAAFNDNREEATNDEVHCIWLRDHTIGITYDASWASREPEVYRKRAFFTFVAVANRLIITHDAKLYRGGKLLSFADIFRLIDVLAKTPPEKGNAHVGAPPQSRLMLDHPVASLVFSLPPPNKDAVGLDISPASLLEAFVVYGAAKNVQVHSSW